MQIARELTKHQTSERYLAAVRRIPPTTQEPRDDPEKGYVVEEMDEKAGDEVGTESEKSNDEVVEAGGGGEKVRSQIYKPQGISRM